MNRIARHFVLFFASATVFSLLAGPQQWEERNGFRCMPLTVPSSAKTGFTALGPSDTGILCTNIITGEQVAKRYNMVSGSGVAAGDFDGDGRCDLYFCNRTGENALFRNLGNQKFQNVAAAAGVACANQCSVGATFADVTGDGLLDLLVSTFFGPNLCLINLGNGRFASATESAGLSPRGGATSLALGDVDGDGDLDLYLGYFGVESILREGGRLSFTMADGKPMVTGRHARRLKVESGQLIELGEQDVLYLNDGKGRFTPANWAQFFRDENGQPVPAAPLDFGLSVQIRDINEDGYPDIYVCNDFQTPDRVWLNDGHGRFRAIPRLALRNMSYASMGVDFADIDRDGRLDFITVEMLSREHAHRLRQLSSMAMKGRQIRLLDDREAVPRNALYWNRGDGTYAEIAWFSGVEASDWSWTPIFLDVDLDGFEDLLVSTGSLYDVMDLDAAAAAGKLTGPGAPGRLLSLYPPLDNRNAAFRNRGDLTFEDVTRAWGFDSRQVSQGAALVDLEGDGDLDVVMNCANAPPLICRNDSSAPRVAVRLKGLPPNRQGIGAKIKLFGGAVPVQSQEVICGGRYLSGDQPMRVFAAGTLTNAMRLEVTWRNGRRSVVNEVNANWLYEVDEERAAQVPMPAQVQASEAPAFFEDASTVLKHTHHEEEYNDYERQPLLPKKLSQSGPGVAWLDVDEDGWDDLAIGSGKGGRLAVYRNNRKGVFERLHGQPWDEVVSRDQAGLAGTGRFILAGSSNYEDGLETGGCVKEYGVSGKATGDAFPGQPSSTGPLALADCDGDGALELFVGGRVMPGRYPEPATSLLFRQRQGRWELDAENTKQLSQAGLVSGAVWSDLDGDGFPELILACEWGPLRLFRNNHGRLAPWQLPVVFAGPNPGRSSQARSSLSELFGWWNGVATGDFDGDGRMDIIASNWGLNSRYRPSQERPCKIYYGDVAGRQAVDLIEAHYDEALQAEVPQRGLNTVSASFPFVPAKFSTHAAYTRASLREIYEDKLPILNEVRATTLETMLFLNRGDHFEVSRLPREAQFSAAFAVCPGDLDGDGNEDVFLSQNFFATQPETSRLDAGRGLWLKGDGKGRFEPLSAKRSGVAVYGEQRGAALADYDRDGRVDLVVTQNGASTKLYHNVGARPGLRVRLLGPEGNPFGFGAQMRLQYESSVGAVREIHAGSGYWSQDSAVQVLGNSQNAKSLWVRWPGGRVMTVSLPPKAVAIEVAQSGEVRVER